MNMRHLTEPLPKKPKGPKNAPTPAIPRPQVNQNLTAQKQPSHPEMYTQQLNPISNKFGLPQYQYQGTPKNFEPERDKGIPDNQGIPVTARDQGLPGDALKSLLAKLFLHND